MNCGLHLELKRRPLRSWLMVAGLSRRQTGSEWARIMPRTTMRMVDAGRRSRDAAITASGVMWSSESDRYGAFISLADTQGTSPFQKAGFSLLGVPPLTRLAR